MAVFVYYVDVSGVQNSTPINTINDAHRVLIPSINNKNEGRKWFPKLVRGKLCGK